MGWSQLHRGADVELEPPVPLHLPNPQPRPPVEQEDGLFTEGLLSSPCNPGANDLQGDSNPVDLPRVVGMDGGVCCEIL